MSLFVICIFNKHDGCDLVIRVFEARGDFIS